tara:strand:+ start:146 stop:598 length:453 start_codon:yes stop_codon:yes gene_type:complete
MREEDIINIQKQWASGIVKMGELSNDRDSLESFTSDFLDKIYDFDNQVLFKPTKAANEQFRNSKSSAFSYFIAGDNRECQEDKGFALSNWTEIFFDNSNIIINEDIAIAMGNYTFKNEVSKIKVEYSFVYKNYGNEIKIILHHSSLPYKI